MPTYSLKDKYNQSLKPWFFAISVCVAANLFLYVLFSMTNKENIERPPDRPHVVMLPLDGRLNQSLQNVIAWMDDENPTLIVCPNVEYGYSRILLSGSDLSLQKPEVPPLNYKDILTKQVFSPICTVVSVIPVKVLTITDFLKELTNLQTAFLPKINNYPILHPKIEYPNVSELFTGTNIPVIFYDLGSNNALITKLQPQRSTIVQLYVPDNDSLLLSGKIIESSGSPELDTIALNNLQTIQLPSAIFNKYKNKVILLKIEWAQLFKEI